MFIELTPQEVEAIEKWQKYHNESQGSGSAFYTYKYNGAQLQSTDPVDASHLKDLIKKENKPYSMADELEKAIKEITRPINTEPNESVIPLSDMVNSPAHYNTGTIEVITYLQDKLTPEAFKGFLAGNCLKYLSRYEHKNGVEDLKKCRWYLDKLITELE